MRLFYTPNFQKKRESLLLFVESLLLFDVAYLKRIKSSTNFLFLSEDLLLERLAFSGVSKKGILCTFYNV